MTITNNNIPNNNIDDNIITYFPEDFVKFDFKMDKLDLSTNMKIINCIASARTKPFIEYFKSRYPNELGYVVTIPVKKKGEAEPDIIILKNTIPFMVIEIKNYRVDGYMIPPVINRAIKALTKYNCYRLLVVSSLENLRIRKYQIQNNKKYYYYTNYSHTEERLRKNGIDVMWLDRQDINFNDIFKIFKKRQIEGWKE